MMKGMSVVAICLCSLLLSAWGWGDSELKKVVQGSLKDPDSAKFGSITVVTDKVKQFDGKVLKSACVTVNAKNAMGGYAGSKQALLRKVGDGEWAVSGFYASTHAECVDVISSNNRNNR